VAQRYQHRLGMAGQLVRYAAAGCLPDRSVVKLNKMQLKRWLLCELTITQIQSYCSLFSIVTSTMTEHSSLQNWLLGIQPETRIV